MFHWLSVGEVEYITNLERQNSFYILPMFDAASQTSVWGQSHFFERLKTCLKHLERAGYLWVSAYSV